MEVTNAAPITPENLISNVFLGDGVTVLGIQYDGDDRAVGLFTNGEDEVGMNRGIVMTTGRAVTQGADVGVNSPGGTQAAEGTTSTVFDQDLADLADGNPNINDVSRYTITFIPTSDTLRFTYAFGSEEYPEYACSQFNDIFGFFISGPGINGPFSDNAENIALIPGTDLPVRINNVNAGVVGANGTIGNCTPPAGSLDYSGFYNDNLNSNALPVYDGFTEVFIAEAIVMPCSTYTIKLAIADINDGSHDSGVFLEAKSFGTEPLDVEIVGLALDGGLAEGCGEGEIVFSFTNPVEDTYVVDFDVSGTATPDVDYPALPDSVVMMPGDSTVSITLEAFEDFIDEGDETIEISVQRDPCNRDTFTIVIKDNLIELPELGPDLVICDTEEVQLDGTIPIVLPDPPTFVNNTPLQINQSNVAFTSEIEVFGVLPVELGPDAIKMICIDSLEHRWIDDLDIFIVSPDGQFLELSTDNGGNGGNGLGLDYYANTCFTVDATTPINFPGPLAPPSAVPFTGEWLPEGVWSDLWDGQRATNGTWTLVITDDTQGLDGTLFSWRICFNAVYQIDYSWEPTTGLSCADCPDPIASPDETTTYVMTATDSYGCTVQDSVTIEVIPSLDMIDLVCDQATTSSVSVLWTDVPGANSYEVSVNGGAWTTPTGALAHSVTGLGLVESVEISVRAIGDCPGEPLTVTCSTLNCTPATLAANTTDVSCFSGTDGAVTVSVVSGTAPFTYELEGAENDTGLFTDLESGSYVATVTDGDGCPGTIAFNILEPPSPTFEPLVEQAVSCFSGTDGQLTVAATDGNGPYSFDWGGGITDSIATGLGAGPYQVNLLDVNGCAFTVDLMLDEPEELTTSIEGVDVDCNGTASGSAQVLPTGGTLPYTYLWSDGQVTDTAYTLVANDYTVVITDANGCEVTEAITINEPAALTALPDATPVLCNGDNNGSASVEVNGGTADYSYLWIRMSTGEEVGDTPLVEDLPADDYQLVLTDANGCELTETISITTPDELVLIDFQAEDPSCDGAADGTGSIAAQGGTEPYVFTWDGAEIGETINTLGAGEHSVEVMDANGCTATQTFVLTAPTALSLSISTDSVSCLGFSDGTASVEATGGTLPYTFLWGDGQDAQQAVDLPAGTASVVVTDANGCVAEMADEVLSPTQLVLAIDGEDPSCNLGADGNVSVVPTGGSAPYIYSWDDGQDTPTAVGLPAGIHTVEVTDANGCTETISLTLGEPTALAINVTVEEQGCTGVPDGEAIAVVSGGTAPYSYNWDDPASQTTQTATGLVTGAYAVTVTDAQGCTIESSADVPQAESVMIEDFTFGDVSCNGGADGTISIIASGGETPYTFNWSDASIPNTANPMTLVAGTYEVTVVDNNQCSEAVSVTISEPAALSLATTITNVVCAGETTGAIDLSVTGGTAPYQYNWSNNASLEDIDALAAGDYTVFVTDALGCVAQINSTIDEAPPLALRSVVEPVDCFGLSTGSIANEISGGQPPYDVVWSDGNTDVSRPTLRAGNYDVLITDAYGCTYEEQFVINEPAALETALSAEAVSCYGGRDGMIQVDVAGGTPSYRYRIDNEPYGGTSAFVGLAAGDYNISVVDANGCEQLAGSINVAEPDPIEVYLGEDLTIRYGDTIEVVPTITAPYPIISYTWEPFDSTWVSCADCASVNVFPDYQADLFLTVMDEFGCIGEDWIRIIVRKDFPVQVPTGFTPNGDGMNDLLMVHGLPGIEVVWFRVFDRWGEEVFSRGDFGVNDPAVGWDGTFRDQALNGGVYLWQVEVRFPDGKTERYTGQTTLIR